MSFDERLLRINYVVKDHRVSLQEQVVWYSVVEPTRCATRLQQKTFLENKNCVLLSVCHVIKRSVYMTNRVISSLGHVKLQDLTGDMFQTLYARWLKEKMSPNTIRLIHTIIWYSMM